MRRSYWTRVFAVLLVCCMLATTASATGVLVGGEGTQPKKAEQGYWLQTDSGADESAALRASTYTLISGRSSRETTGSVVKYFPVTMYNYDMDTINDATDDEDDNLDLREGMYFTTGGLPYTTAAVLAPGKYYIQNIRANANGVASYLQADEDQIKGVNIMNATVWTLVVEGGENYLTCQIDGTTHYLVVGTNGDTDGYTTTKTPITITGFTNSNFSNITNGVQLSQNGYYLCQWGGNNVLVYGGYNQNNDGGNGMLFIPADEVEDAVPVADLTPGQYYIQNILAREDGTDSYLQGKLNADNSTMIHGVSRGEATVWTLEVEDGEYYLTCDINGEKNYLVVGTDVANGGSDGCTTIKTPIEITDFSHASIENGVQLSLDGYYLGKWIGALVAYGAYGQSGNNTGMLFFPADERTGNPGRDIISGYEIWNRWDKCDSKADGDLFVTGLVRSELENDQIVFNVPEGGIFDDNTDVKTVYENVGLPFVLDPETGVYSFDSDINGVYFLNGAASDTNLHFDEGNPQPMPDGESVGDGSTNAFFPFNSQWTDTDNNGKATYVGGVDYFFGMRADLPFSMTPNGCIKSTDNNSEPIQFTFSGDDDVWVFIDGYLVIDLGGLHNRLDVTIDFAANTIVYSEENAQDLDSATGSYNEPGFATTQRLFTEDGQPGLLPMTREAFALTPDHELDIFYLERGAGTSNCRIEFNLPMTDTVLVTKDATHSWSQIAEDAGDHDPGLDDGVFELTRAEQAAINNIDFGFTLYKKVAGETGFTPVAGTNFYLIGRGVTGVVIEQTDANGHFYLKNGQSAKFITEIPAEGVTYYVVEDLVPDGFVSPDYNYAGSAAYDYSYTDGTDSGTAPAADASGIPEQIIPMPETDENGQLVWAENKSYEVTVKGSIENSDSIEFICSNYLNNELPIPTALTYEDIIVLDYGLSVVIDPLANDIVRGDSVEIICYGDADLTLEDHQSHENGEILATDQTLAFGSVRFNNVTYDVAEDGTITHDTFTYTLDKPLTGVEVISYIIKSTADDESDYAIGKIYIVPATVMYYEENFSDMIKFEGAGWRDASDVTNAEDVDIYQEQGVMATPDDSIYGSDAAYRSDNGDSNGTSRYADTTNKAVRFTYTFTGTGTTIFARTSATTGYVQIKIYDGTDTGAANYRIAYVDTYYKDQNTTDQDDAGVLYNIPIYTIDELPYGTYTVVVTVAKAGTKTGNPGGAGHEFFLDGIRIMQPLNEADPLADKAKGAYAADGEANIEVVTLRNKLIDEYEPDASAETEAQWPFAVMTDIEGEIVYASDYISIGPNEEVYLLPGQSVSFAVKYWHPDGYRMHMGMKAPFGSATVQVGHTEFVLNNAADCYYDITGMEYSVTSKTLTDNSSYHIATYTFTATDGIVALTNIKITGNYQFVLIENPAAAAESGKQGE